MTQIMIYDVNSGKPIGVRDKKETHEEFHEAAEKGKPQPHKHEHVGVYLLDGNKNLLTSIRDFLAKHNPNLIDKSFGSHIPMEYNTDAAILEVASREFQIPTAIVTKKELTNIILNHPELLKKQAFITTLDYNGNFDSKRKRLNKKPLNEICMQEDFIGIYDGKYKSTENTGIRPFNLEKLITLKNEHPKKFTGDLKNIMTNYLNQLKALSDIVSQSLSIDEERHEELIKCYSMDGSYVKIETRKKVHEPIQKSYLEQTKQKLKHKHVGGLLLGKEGEIYVQIRSEDKAENPGMYDKLVGGHIPAGDLPIVATYHEFIEEMGIPIALAKYESWINILKNCPQSIRNQAICLEISPIINYESERKRKNDDDFVEICDQYFTIGYYGGSFRFVDKEAAGIFQFSDREHLRDEMEKFPNKFTGDLKFMVKEYWNELIPLKKRIS